MMQLFNDIRGMPQDVGVLSNHLSAYKKGANFTLTNSIVDDSSEDAQFNVA